MSICHFLIISVKYLIFLQKWLKIALFRIVLTSILVNSWYKSAIVPRHYAAWHMSLSHVLLFLQCLPPPKQMRDAPVPSLTHNEWKTRK